MQRKRFIVDRVGLQWVLTEEGAAEPLGSFGTKRAAINRGRRIAQAHGHSQLQIRNKDHAMQNQWNYGGERERKPKQR
jgi:hypothetical protein